jgi:hypothetical protein
MKNVKNAAKNNNMMWWKIAGVAVAIILLAVGAYYMVRLWERIGQVNDNQNMTGWEIMGLRHYGEVEVSDDGKWYLVPEVRVKFPFGPTFYNEEEAGAGVPLPIGPLRYNVMYSTPEDGENGFRVELTHDVVDEFTAPDIYPEGNCAGIFVIDYNYNHTDQWGREYEAVAEVSLTDGRKVVFKERTNGKRCAEFNNSDRGGFLKELFSQLESY